MLLYLQGMPMINSPQREPKPGARRAARIAVAAGLVAALSAAGPIPAAVAADSAPATADPSVKSAHDKLGSDDADRLAEAKASGEKYVTMMVATAPGQTEKVAAELDAVVERARAVGLAATLPGPAALACAVLLANAIVPTLEGAWPRPRPA